MRAPSTSANLGSGFDVVAVAHDAYHAEAHVKVEAGCGVSVKFRGFDPGPHNTVAEALRHMFRLLDTCRHVEVEVDNGIPVARGLGSSGASAVAALAAFLREAGLKADPRLVVRAAGLGEAAAAGSPHFDNAAAAALGGAVVITSLDPLDVASFSPRLTFAVAVPDVPPLPNKTKRMREVLPRHVDFPLYVRQLSRLASLVAGLATSDPRLVARGMEDQVVEAARAPLVPAYHRVRRYALEAGALAVCISGAGPAMLALTDDRHADAVKAAMARAYAEEDIKAEVKVAQVAPGAISI